MYSVVLMAAMTAGGQAPDCHGCHSYGNCYGSCYGNYGVEGLNCSGGSYNGYGSCWGSCNGCWGTYSNACNCSGGYNGYGSCWGSCNGCWGSAYSWDWSSNGCNGCWGAYGMTSPYFVQTPNIVAPPVVAPVNPPTKAEPIPSPKPGETAAPTKARLIVEAPADAKLYIDDHAMKTTSDRRTYQTPELQPGQTYYYEVRVEVERDGKTLSETRRVLLHAGQEVRADFSDVTSTATAKAK